ncbi:MAG: hypothetical protein V3T01_09205 [Myxococcota bacterium]
MEIPGEPLQTKYPILYPALLAIGFLLRPDYPDNLTLLRIPGALMAAGFVVLSGLYLDRVLGGRRAWVFLAVSLAALSPEILSLVRVIMSDLPHACISIAALLCLDLGKGATPREGRDRPRLAWAGLLIGAAMLTRSIGLTLAIAAPLTLLFRRRFADAALVFGVAVLTALPWWIWQIGAATANGAMQTSPIEAYDLNYGLWLPSDPGQLWLVARQNFFRAIFGLTYFQFAAPGQWATEAIATPSWRTIAFHGVCYAAAALMITGFFVSARRRLQTIHVYAVLYGGAVIIWPFEPYRFLVAWTPFLIYFTLTGLRSLSSWLRFSGRTIHPRWLVEAPAGLLCALLFVWFIREDARILASNDDRFYILRTYYDRSDHAELTQWLRDHTRDGDVLASNDTADLFLAVGRQVRDTTPGIDLVGLCCGADRRWREFYALSGASELRALVDRASPHLPGLFRGGDIAYYVQHGEGGTAAPMERLIGEKRTWFEPVFRTRHRAYRVFRVTVPPI